MNYNKQIAIIFLFISTFAFGMEKEMPTQPTMQPRETLSTETALLFNAISKKDAHEVEDILSKLSKEDAKAVANSFDKLGKTPLFRAIEANDLKIVHLLFAHEADPNVATKGVGGRPPLREAMIGGNIDIIKELIRNNADVNKPDNYYITPLMMAVSQGPAQAAFLLIEAGADVNAEDRGGQTVWNYSTFSSSRKVSPEEKAKIQELLEKKDARKMSIKK
jgi:ankyrin repeat protein